MNGSDMRVTKLIMKVQMFGVSANQRLKLVKQVARVKYPKRQHKDANWDDLCQSLCMHSKQDQKKKNQILQLFTNEIKFIPLSNSSHGCPFEFQEFPVMTWTLITYKIKLSYLSSSNLETMNFTSNLFPPIIT